MTRSASTEESARRVGAGISMGPSGLSSMNTNGRPSRTATEDRPVAAPRAATVPSQIAGYDEWVKVRAFGSNRQTESSDGAPASLIATGRPACRANLV